MTNANPWTKFFWNDWENDPALRLCSLAAQGLWMRLLCIAAKANPTGFVIIAGRPCASTDISRLTGEPEQEVESLLDELSRNGVFSRDAQNRIYCRRMVRDSRKSTKMRQNGAKGGRATAQKNKDNFPESKQKAEQKSRQDNQPQKPESRVHKNLTPEGPPTDFETDRPPPTPPAEVVPLDVGWSLPDEWKQHALERGWSKAAITKQAGKFKGYFAFGRGIDVKRSERGWKQTWNNWLARELRSNPDAATFGQKESQKLPASYPPLPEPVRQKLEGHYSFKEGFIKRWLQPCIIDLEAGTITAPSSFHAEYLDTHYGPSLEHAFGRPLTFKVGASQKPIIQPTKGEL